MRILMFLFFFFCRLTYDATLTEPTNLKMMRSVKDEQMRPDDISELW